MFLRCRRRHFRFSYTLIRPLYAPIFAIIITLADIAADDTLFAFVDADYALICRC